MSKSAIQELKDIVELQFGPEWTSFNHYDPRLGYVDAVVVDRYDGQRIPAKTLHQVFNLIPEVLKEISELERKALKIYRSPTDED